MSDPTSDLLDRFFAAIVAGDLDAVEGCYADDVEVWHNVTGRSLDKQASIDLLRFWHGAVADMSYEILERHTHDGGAHQRHIVRGRAKGEDVEANVAITFHVADGRITRIYEYLDPAAVAAVFGRG